MRGEQRQKIKLQSRTLILIASLNEGEERKEKWGDEVIWLSVFPPSLASLYVRLDLKAQWRSWWGGWRRRGMRSRDGLWGGTNFGGVHTFTCVLIVIMCCALLKNWLSYITSNLLNASLTCRGIRNRKRTRGTNEVTTNKLLSSDPDAGSHPHTEEHVVCLNTKSSSGAHTIWAHSYLAHELLNYCSTSQPK